MRGAVKVIISFSLCVVGFGCARPPGPIVSTERSHVLILSGCNGTTQQVERFRTMIDEEAEGVSSQVWDWAQIRPATLLINQWDYPRNMHRVDRLVHELKDWREKNPDTHLYLVGFSGGAAFALWAVERLPEDFGVERIVLMGGSVAPDYDLTKVLQRTHQGVFNYYSFADKVFLRDGTIIHGTMERKFCESAGYSGFVAPENPQLASKLEQFKWDPSMKELGNHGRHWGPFAEPFLRTYFLPLFDQSAQLTWESVHVRAGEDVPQESVATP